MTKMTIDTMYADRRFGRGGWTRRFGLALWTAVSWFGRQSEKRRSRMRLLELTDEQLKDIGISRCDANGEAWRRFWE